MNSIKKFGFGVFAPLAASVAIATVFASSAHAQGFLYVGDYDGARVHQFNATTGKLVNGDYIIPPGGNVEGMGGLGSNLFVASGNSIYNYNIGNGTTAPTLVNSFGSTSTYQIAISNDGHYLYAAQAGQLARYDLTASNINASVKTVSTPNSWGVAIGKDGSVYVNNGWSSKGNVGIQKFSADLSTSSYFVTPTQAAAAGFTAGAGLTFDNAGNLWAVNGGNADPNNGFVSEYSSTGTLLQTVKFSSGVNRPFGAAIGQNGDVFVSTQGSGGCVLEIHNNVFGGTTGFAQNSVSTFVTVSTSSSVASSSLQSAKTIFFSSQTVATPEPSEFVFAGIFGLGLFGMIVRARRNKAA